MKRNRILIEADELLTKLNDTNIRIYDATSFFDQAETDITSYETYLQGHIPGAAFFDHLDFSDASSEYSYTMATEEDLATQIGKIGISEDSEVVFYTTGVLPCATRAWWILHYTGHNNVRILNGGLTSWVKAGGKLEQESRQYESTKFECHLRPNVFASKDEVKVAMDDDSIFTEYTLTPDMYGGVKIPNSSIIPCLDLMQEMDFLLSDDELASRLKREKAYERIITYCGGGIAATVNAIAHLILGNENVAVYDGSLAEWLGEGLPTTKAE